MRRLAEVWIGSFLLCACGFAFSPASNAGAQPLDLAAGYMLHTDIQGHGYTRGLMTLLENHTGYTDLDSIAWSRTGKRITLVFRNRSDQTYEATYGGTLVPTGISTRRDPGTISGAHGETGVFYAINKTNQRSSSR